MSRDRTITKAGRRGVYALVPVLGLVVLMLAACGGGGGSAGTTISDDDPEAEAAAATVAVVKVESTPELGRVLVDAGGMTLYDSHGDNPMLYQFDRPPTPACYEACARIWSPVMTAGAPQPGGGAERDLLGTIGREDGGMQVTYAGHPLYTYANDKLPGETNGDDAVSFGEAWHALEPDGEEPGA